MRPPAEPATNQTCPTVPKENPHHVLGRDDAPVGARDVGGLEGHVAEDDGRAEVAGEDAGGERIAEQHA